MILYVDWLWLPWSEAEVGARLATLGIKATVVFVVGGCVSLALRRTSAAWRAWCWTATLGALPIVVAASALPAWTVPLLVVDSGPPTIEQPLPGPVIIPSTAPGLAARESHPAESSSVAHTMVTASSADQSSPEMTSGDRAIAEPSNGGMGAKWSETSDALPPATSARDMADAEITPAHHPSVWLAYLWLAGTCVAVVRILAMEVCVRSAVRTAQPMADPMWQRELDALRVEARIRRPVAIHVSNRPASPWTSGAWQPVIVLPPASRQWEAACRRMVLLHELAHVRRCDALVQLLVRFAWATFWFHPLAWLAIRRWKLESERAADDAVLSAGVKQADYAAELVQLARTLSLGHWLPATAMARPAQLECRVAAILDTRYPRRPVGLRMAAVGALVATAGALALATIQPWTTHVAAALPAKAEAPPAVARAAKSDNGLPAGAVARLGDGRFRGANGSSVKYTADGRRLVSIVSGQIVFWNAETGRRERTIKPHDVHLQGLAMAPNGEWVASTSNKDVYVFTAAGSEPRHVLKGNENESRAWRMAASPDGKLLATSTLYDKAVRVWRPESGELVHTLNGHTSPPVNMEFTAKADTLVSADQMGAVLRWDVASGKLLGQSSVAPVSQWQIRVVPGGQRIAAADDQRLRVYDISDGAQWLALPTVYDWSFSTDGALAVFGNQVWDLNSRRQIVTLDREATGSGAISPDGKTLACSMGTVIRHFDLTTGRDREVKTEFGHTSPIRAMAFSPNGKYLVTGASGGSRANPALAVWDVAERKRMLPDFSFISDEGKDRGVVAPANSGISILDVDVSFDGKQLVATDGNAIRTWSLPDGTPLEYFRLPSCNTVRFLPFGKQLATSDDKNHVVVWDHVAKERKADLEDHWGRVSCLAVARPGDVFASGSHDRSVNLWDVETHQRRHTLEGLRDSVKSVSLSDDGRVVAAAADSTEVIAWDARSGRRLHQWPKPPGWSPAVAVSADGKLVACAAGKVFIWSVKSGKKLAEFEDEDSHVSAGAFSPDGKLLATGCWNGTVVFWDMAKFAGQ